MTGSNDPEVKNVSPPVTGNIDPEVENVLPRITDSIDPKFENVSPRVNESINPEVENVSPRVTGSNDLHLILISEDRNQLLTRESYVSSFRNQNPPDDAPMTPQVVDDTIVACQVDEVGGTGELVV